MALDELIPILHKLSRSDKVRAMQVLVNDLATEEEPMLVAGARYEIFTPFGNEDAAQKLYELLQAAEAEDNAKDSG
jgi:hypothetical protein